MNIINLTSEQVHWIYGTLVSSISLGLIVAKVKQYPQKLSQLLIIGTIFLFSFCLLIDPLLHGDRLPGSYFQEMRQHNTLGLLLLGLGTVEFLRFKKVLNHVSLSLFLPLSVIVTGIIFFFHAQHDSHVSMLLLMTQHRIYGVTLLVAGVTKLLAYSRKPTIHASPFAVTWLVCLFIFGLELLLYTEGSLLIQH